MSDQPGPSTLKTSSPKKKRFRKTALRSAEKTSIINIYKQVEETWPKDRFVYKDELISRTAETAGVSTSTVYKVLKKYKTDHRVVSPVPPPKKLTKIDKLLDFELNAIRKKVHDFFLRNEMPTVDKILQTVNDDDDLPNFKRTTFQKLLKKLKIEYLKRSRKSTLISKVREDRHKLYNTDETWLKEGSMQEAAKDTHLQDEERVEEDIVGGSSYQEIYFVNIKQENFEDEETSTEYNQLTQIPKVEIMTEDEETDTVSLFGGDDHHHELTDILKVEKMTDDESTDTASSFGGDDQQVVVKEEIFFKHDSTNIGIPHSDSIEQVVKLEPNAEDSGLIDIQESTIEEDRQRQLVAFKEEITEDDKSYDIYENKQPREENDDLNSDFTETNKVHCVKTLALDNENYNSFSSNTGTKQYTCNVCDWKFGQNDELKMHLSVHNYEKLYCAKYNVKFRRMFNLDTHTTKFDLNGYVQDHSYILTHNTKPHVDTRKKSKKSYKCFKCSKAFKENSLLIQHKLIHTEKKPTHNTKPHVDTRKKSKKSYKCFKCSKAFKENNLLIQHKLIHTEKKPTHNTKPHVDTRKKSKKSYKCFECSKAFKENSLLIQHKLIHTEKKPFACHNCSKSFKDSSVLKRHIKTHTVINTFGGDDQQVVKEEIFFEHDSTNIGIPHSDSIEQVVKLEPNAEDSGLIDIQESTIEEDRQRQLVAFKDEITEDDKSYDIYENKQLIEENDDLNSDFTETNKVHCVNTLALDNENYNSFSSNTGTKQNTCNVCDWKFAQNHELKMHLLVHTYEKSCFSCDKCNMKFTCKFNLDNHTTEINLNGYVHDHLYLRTHNEKPKKPKKPFKCYECCKAFKENSLLIQHNLSHTEKKPFACHTCSKSFKDSSVLKRHIKTHEDINTYACNRCNKVFEAENKFKKHIRTHSG